MNVVRRIPIVRPSLGEEEIQAVARVMRSGWISQGPEVAEFEKEFARSTGASHAVAVSNCTVALELAMRVTGVRAGDDVATVSHSFVATANSIIAVGARPLFVDVDQSTLGMDPRALDRVITPSTKAVLAVHQIGIPCDIFAIREITRRHGIPLIEDAACAIGSEIEQNLKWERIGRPHGDVACFSFHPRKVLTTGDGGMITTNDPAVAERLKLLRQHAMSISDVTRHQADDVVFEDYLEPAYNFRMTDLQAAVGRVQLSRLDGALEERRRIARVYGEAFAGDGLLETPRVPVWGRSNWQSYPLFLRGDEVSQREAMRFLLRRGIACKRGISNAHQEPAYQRRGNWTCGDPSCEHQEIGQCPRLRTSEWLRDRTILVPLFHGMLPGEVQQVIDACSELEGYRGVE